MRRNTSGGGGFPVPFFAHFFRAPPHNTFSHPPHTHPHPRACAAKTFAEIEAEKDARTPDQAEWLRRAETKIPIGQAPSAESSKAREALAGGGGGGGAK